MSAPITYRVSALAGGCAAVTRATPIIALVIIANALIQAALLLPGVLPGATVTFIIVSVVSYLVLVASLTVTIVALLRAIDGGTEGVGLGDVITSSWRRFGPTLAWSLLLLALTIIGLSLYVIPGFIVLALFPYLLIAVVDRGRGPATQNPLAVNFSTIGARFGRWLVTVVLMGLMCAVLWLLATVTGFFIAGPLGSLIAWIVLGAMAAWFIATWAVIYRSVHPLAPGNSG